MLPIDPQSCSNAMTSRLLGCSANTLSKLAGRGIVPRVARGRYNLFEAAPAYVAYRKGEHTMTRGEVAASQGLMEARTQKLQLENSRRAAVLIDTESTWALYRECVDVISMLATEVLVHNADLAVALSKEFEPLQIRNILGEQISLVMNTIQEALDLDG